MASTYISGTSGADAFNKYSDRTPKQELGKDEFLQILATQLANQDPLEPTSDTEFIAQMAQFSSLEQMQEMNNAAQSSRAYALVGKDIIANVSDEAGNAHEISGRVSGVTTKSGTDYLIVGEYLVPLSAVKYVYDTGATDQSLLAQAGTYIGKTVEAELPTGKYDSTTGKEITEKVTGVVESIYLKGGLVYAKLEGSDKDVLVAFINKYYETPQAAPGGNTGGTGEADGETGGSAGEGSGGDTSGGTETVGDGTEG